MHISNKEREAVYKTIHARRDVRGEFTDTPIDEQVLGRILGTIGRSLTTRPVTSCRRP